MKAEHIDPVAFLEAMSLPVRQAGAAVRWLEGRVENFPKPGESSEAKAALTYGDCVSQEILLTALREHYPWVEVEAEEDTPTAIPFADNRSRQRVLIDPIDGTLRYVQRDGIYAILLGLESEHGIEASIVGLPQEQLVIRAVRGCGVELAYAGEPFRSFDGSSISNTRPRVLVSHELPPGLWQALETDGFEVEKAAGGAIGVAPLLRNTVAAIRTTTNPQGLSRRTWISTLATREIGGCVETGLGPLPSLYEPGVAEILVGASSAVVTRLRKLLLEA